MWREHSEDIVVFVYRFAIVSALLLIPPDCIRVAKLASDGRRVGITSVLSNAKSVSMPVLPKRTQFGVG